MREMGWWILDENHTPQFVGTGVDPAMRYHDKVWKRVAEDHIGPYHISTVFLGIDHGFGEGPPLLFETMVFARGSLSDLEMERYSTWNQAVAGHQAMLKEVRSWGWKKRIRDEVVGAWRLFGLYSRVLLTRIGNLRASKRDTPRPTPPRRHW